MQNAGVSLPSAGRKRKRKNKNKKKTAATTDDPVPVDQDLTPHTAPTNHSDDEQGSDNEHVVKKKKKKNKPVPTEPGKKGAKSIRQMKREKHAARIAEAESVAKDALKLQCLQYLSQWKHDRANWKFMKAKQLWLFKHKFSLKHVPNDSWLTFLEYFSSAQGNIKNMLLEDANKVIAKMDACLEKVNDGKEDEATDETNPNSEDKPDEESYKRARDIIQHLEE